MNSTTTKEVPVLNLNFKLNDKEKNMPMNYLRHVGKEDLLSSFK